MADETRIAALVLAGERAGGNALARAHGVPAGVLVEVAGRSCLERVVDALRASHRIDGGLVVGPDRAIVENSALLQAVFAPGDFAWQAPAAGPSASALAGCRALARYPVLMTAGDHALLNGPLLDDFCARALASHADFVVGLVPWAQVRAAWPESRRTLLRFRDGACCGANLFLLRTPRAGAVLEFWREVEAARKHPWRIARRLGAVTLLRYASGTLDRRAALERLSRRTGAVIDHVLIDDPRAAVDVDSSADLTLAERILLDDAR